MAKNSRIAILTNVILNYRFPVFEELANTPGWDLRIFLSQPLSKSDPAARERLPLHYSKTINLSLGTYHRMVDTEQREVLPLPLFLPWDLVRFRPDVIISGDMGIRSLLAYFVACMLNVRFVIWSEEIRETAASISFLQRRLRSFLIPRASAYLAWGRPAVDYLDTWRVSPDRIYYCAQAVDNDFWIKESARCDRNAFREKLGLKGKVFLAVGQLIPRKGFDLLLEAWARLPQNIQSDNTIVIVGEGASQELLRELATQLGIWNILFVARQTSEELAKYYAVADVLIFPSLVDVWGMVVNEALACGTPVLGSRFAGASQELLNDSTIGELFDPLDSNGFTALLHKWCVINSNVSREQRQARIAACHFGISIYAIRKAVEDLRIPADAAKTQETE